MDNVRGLIVLTVAIVVVALAVVWIAPVVGTHNSICNRDPYAAGCR